MRERIKKSNQRRGRGGEGSQIWLIVRYHEVEIYSIAFSRLPRPLDLSLISIETTFHVYWLDQRWQDQDVKQEVCVCLRAHTPQMEGRRVTHHLNKQKHFQSKQVIPLPARFQPLVVCVCVCGSVCPLTGSTSECPTHKYLEKCPDYNPSSPPTPLPASDLKVWVWKPNNRWKPRRSCTQTITPADLCKSGKIWIQ